MTIRNRLNKLEDKLNSNPLRRKTFTSWVKEVSDEELEELEELAGLEAGEFSRRSEDELLWLIQN